MSTNRTSRLLDRLLRLLGLAILIAAALFLARTAHSQPSPAAAENVLPAYDAEGRLFLPEDFRQWIFVGASLGLSYSEGSGGTEMFHETLMEPSAYAHFAATGEFREGTMLALLLHEPAENVLPQRRGRFAGPLAAVEMAVKDSSRSERGWEYYGFGGRDGLRREAQRIGSDSCYGCHRTEAAHDNVFLQFYPLLAERAPAGTAFTTGAGEPSELDARVAATAGDGETPSAPPVALGGLDPVLLVEGQSELGKPEIEEAWAGFTYRFVSEPTRARFAADPERFAFQNESCPVVPGATLEPALFAVHEGRLYGFATEQCVADFEADPARYLAPEPAGG